MQLFSALRERGYSAWLDVKMNTQDMAAMREGVAKSDVVLAIVSGRNTGDAEVRGGWHG